MAKKSGKSQGVRKSAGSKTKASRGTATMKAPKAKGPPVKLDKAVPPPRSAAPETPAVESPDGSGHLPEEELRKVKTGLTRKDLEFYHDLLMQKRAEILGDVESLEIDVKNDGGNLSNMPLHMADVGSDNYEQEFTLGLIESDRKLLTEINQALLRIRSGTYGVCLLRGVPIGKPRLEITPWAKYCIEVARDMERRGKAG